MEDNAPLQSIAKNVIKPLYKGSSRFSIPVLFVCMGFPGSGKSYLSSKICERYPFYYARSDNVRYAVTQGKSEHTPDENKYVFSLFYQAIHELLTAGQSVYVDSTLLVQQHREELFGLLPQQGKSILLFVNTPQEICKKRLESRKNSFENPLDINFSLQHNLQPIFEKFQREFVAPSTQEADYFLEIQQRDENDLQDNLKTMDSILSPWLSN